MTDLTFKVTTHLNTEKDKKAFAQNPAKYLEKHGLVVKNNVVKAALTEEAKLANALGLLQSNAKSALPGSKGFDRIG
jgi:hypothetical protein